MIFKLKRFLVIILTMNLVCGVMPMGVYAADDVTPPVFVVSTPRPNSTGVLVDANITITFNENIVANTGNLTIYENNGGITTFETIDVTDTSRVTFTDNTVTFNPTSDFDTNLIYTASLGPSAIKDSVGNVCTNGLSWSFTTVASTDNTSPSLTYLSPANNATDVARATNPFMRFSENVKKGTGNISIVSGSSTQTFDVNDAGRVSISGSTVTIYTPSSLSYNTNYYITVADGAIVDMVGNAFAGISDSTTWNFTIREETLNGTLQLTHDGTPQYGETIGVNITGITNSNYGTLSYQWKRDDTDITNAINDTYTLGVDDIGKAILVEVTSDTLDGSLISFSVTSQKANPPSPIFVSKTNNSITIETIPSQAYAIKRTDETTILNYNVIGTRENYIFNGLIENTSYNIYTKADATPTHNGLQSDPLTVTTNPSPPPAGTLTGAITIIHDGTPQYGEELGVDATGITSSNYGELSYQWKRDGTDISGETSEAYTISSQYDIGEGLSVEISSSTLSGTLESESVTPTKANTTVNTPTLVSQTTDSITIETVVGQKYAIWDTSTRHSIQYTLDGDGNNHTYTGLSENTEYYIYTMKEATTTHKWAESQPLRVKVVTPLSPVNNILSITATDTTTNTKQLGASILVNASTKMARLIMPPSTTLSAIRIDYETEDGTTVTGIQSGEVTDFSIVDKGIEGFFTINSGSEWQEWFVAVTNNMPMAPYQITKNNVTQYGESDGSITIDTWYSGYIDYEYSINNGTNWQESATFTNLIAGTYTIQVREKGDTSGEKMIFAPETITQPNRPSTGGGSSSGEGGGSSTHKVSNAKTISSSKKGKDIAFTVEQENVTIEFNGLAFNGLEDKKVQVKVEEVDKDKFDLSRGLEEQIGDLPIFDISIYVDGEIEHFESDKPIVIEIPVNTDKENHKVVAVYIDENGDTQIMEGVLINGIMRFTTNHLSDYALMYVDKSFTDSQNHWGKEAIEALAAREVVNGVGDDLFNPNGEISRAEFATIMVRYFGLTSDSNVNYTDVETDKWYTDYVAIAKDNNILPEIYGDIFEPEKAITREEMMYILYKSLEVTDRLDTLEDNGDKLSHFIDSDMVSNYAVKGSEYLISRDVINGKGNGAFAPKDTSTRAEVAQMMWNMII